MAASAKKTGNIAGIYAAIVTTDGTSGQATLSFPAGTFSVAPVVVTSAVNASGDGRDIVVTTVGAPTSSSCVVLARKSRTIPVGTLVTAYDTLAPVGTTVHILARQPS